MSRKYILSSLGAQLRSLRRVLFLIYAPVVLTLVTMVLIRVTTGFPMADLTRDPLAVVQEPVYIGAVSNLGVLIWAAAATICFFSYAVGRDRSAPNSNSRFLLYGGLITVMLLLDDFFMLHEVVFPDYVGIPENLVYAIYISLIAWFLVWYRRRILEHTTFLLLILALSGFGLMVVMDILEYVNPLPGFYLLEDGFKLFAIVSWTAYFASVGARQLRGSNRE